MEKRLSVIIPNHNGSVSIGKCLEAAFSANYGNFEVIVVDDCSTDDSVETIKRYPCRLIRLNKRSGAGAARNAGAENSTGEILFFTDADCLMQHDALALANKAVTEHPGAVIGGTYTPLPFDTDFFSAFQSLFIHYSETKNKEPDYIAGHAMVIDAGLFKASGGFRKKYLSIPEDVEFSHQLRRTGLRLIMRPEIQAMHMFDFTLMKSLRNALRKSMELTRYSLMNRDLLADSGTASVELKVSVACLFLNALLAAVSLLRREQLYLVPISFLFAFNLFVCRGLIKTFFRAKGLSFSILATLYWVAGYSTAVGVGALAGLVKYALRR